MGWREGEMLFGDRDRETAFGGGGGEEDGRMGWADLLFSPRWANRERGREGKRRNVLHFNRHINLRRDN